MSQVSKLKLVTDIERIAENFLLRITRKIQPDATTQIENILYETDSRFCGKRVEIRYEPEWLNDVTKALPIYEDGKRLGEARVVRFQDNAHAARRFKGNRRKNVTMETSDSPAVLAENSIKNSISYSDIIGGKS